MTKLKYVYEVAKITAELFNHEADDIFSKSRTENLSKARQMLSYICIHKGKISKNSLAKIVSWDRTSINYQIDIAESNINIDSEYKKKFELAWNLAPSDKDLQIDNSSKLIFENLKSKIEGINAVTENIESGSYGNIEFKIKLQDNHLILESFKEIYSL